HTRSYGDWSSDVCSSDLFSRSASALAAKVEFRNVGVLEELLCGPLIAVPARLQNVSAVRYGECLLRVLLHHHDRGPASIDLDDRSEERRVGKGCGRRWVR